MKTLAWKPEICKKKETFLRPNFIALNSFHALETYRSYKLVIYLVMVNLKKKKKKKTGL